MKLTYLNCKNQATCGRSHGVTLANMFCRSQKPQLSTLLQKWLKRFKKNSEIKKRTVFTHLESYEFLVCIELHRANIIR